MASKTFRLGEDSVAALERLAAERELTQTAVIRWALQLGLEEHERELSSKRFKGTLAMRDYELLSADLGENMPEGSWTWHDGPDDDEIMIQIHGTGFVLSDAGPPRRWHVVRFDRTGAGEVGVIEGGVSEVKWVGRFGPGDDRAEITESPG